MDKDNKKNKKKIILTILICVIIELIVMGSIIFLIVKQNSKGEYLTNNSSMNNTRSTVHGGGIVPEKPIIYLYPKKTTEISIKLGRPEKVACSYPVYNNGWNVIAQPNGTLTDINTGRELYSLYWEGIDEIIDDQKDLKEGFVVEKSNLINFLEEKLAILGLNEREAEEFIVYWLPRLQENEYNYIKFATVEEINEIMPLEFSVKPDTLIRVFMEYKPLSNYVEVKGQNLETPQREGFTVVEWGGTEIKNKD